MPKKGKQKQAGQAVPESAPPVVQLTQPLPEIPESREEDAFVPMGHISPLSDDWEPGGGGMQYDHEDQEEVKPVQVRTPSVSASAMASKTNSTSVHAELANAVAAALTNKSGGVKTVKATKGSKGDSSKSENKGGVTWDDGGWDDDPGAKDHSRNHAWGDMWDGNPDGQERHQRDDAWEDGERNVDDNQWDESGEDYGEWEGPQGEPSGVRKNDDDWEQHRHQTTPAVSYSSQWPQPAPPPKPQQFQPAAWMSWGEEARKLTKVTYMPTSSVGPQHQVSTDPHAGWGPSSHGKQSWNQAGPSAKHTPQNGQTWHSTSTRAAGPSQSGPIWGKSSAMAEQTQRTESAWYSKSGYANQHTQKSSQQSDPRKSGRRGRKDWEEHGDGRGRSQRRSGGWGDNVGRDWGDDENEWERGGDEWNRGDDRNRSGGDWGKGWDDKVGSGMEWNGTGNDWNKSGGDWGNDRYQGGNDWGDDWNKGGDDWTKSTTDRDKGRSWGSDWDRGRGNDRLNDWGGNQIDDDDDDDSWDRRVHFTPKSNVSYPIGPTYSMPSKTMAHAYSSLPADFPRDPMQNSMNEFADVRFLESRGAALEPVKNALFGRARPAKERIHWMFPHDKDPRVASLLNWIQRVSYGLAGFGLHKFLQTRERGALFANAGYHPDKSVNEPTFDWLTFDQLQQTRDRTLQESTGFYDPAVQVVVFVFLPSRSRNSVAIWRRKLKVPNNLRLSYQPEISQALAALRKDYVVHVDELPSKKEARPAKRSSKTQKPKRKWWQIFG